MVYSILNEVRERSNINPALVEDIALGNVRPASSLTLGALSLLATDC